MIIRKSLLEGEPEQAREQAEAIAHEFAPPYEYEAGKQLRALAVELVKQETLGVTFVSYEDGAQELEVFFSGDPRNVVTITRNKSGDRCQMTWEQWAGIKDEADIRAVANMVTAVLSSSANSDHADDKDICEHVTTGRKEGSGACSA